MTDAEFLALQAKLADRQQQKAQSEGAYAEMLRQIKDEFGVDSLDAAEALARKLGRKHKRLAAESDAEFARLKKKWGDKL